MAGLPGIDIAFKEEGITAIQRGQRGIVALILKEDNPLDSPVTVITPTDIPEGLSKFNKKQINLALMGYVTPPRRVIVYTIGKEEEDYAKAQKYLETIRFDYVVVPEIAQGETLEFSNWTKALRDTKKKKVKAVLPKTPSDHEGVINFTTDNIKDLAGDEFTTAEYCSRIAGLIAGTPLTIASTFAPLPEVVDCDRLTVDELDAAIGRGELVLYDDGDKIKIARGVNSLVTFTQGKLESFSKIKIVEAMDLIHDDVKRTAEDNYLGKYANSYDNKCLLMMAILGYFEGLELDGILAEGKSEIGIHIARQIAYLKSIGKFNEDMTEQDIKEADTGDKVFLAAKVTILDAIEEIDLEIAI